MINRTKFIADAKQECVKQKCDEEDTLDCVDAIAENVDYYRTQFKTGAAAADAHLNGRDGWAMRGRSAS